MTVSFQNKLANLYDHNQVSRELYHWLTPQLQDTGLTWLEWTLQQLSEDASEVVLFTQFSAAPRRVGKADLALTAADLQTAQRLRDGWMPGHWSVDQAARALLLLTFPADDGDRYVTTIEKLTAAADVAEQVALYQTLPLLPHQERFKARVIDGLRTHINAVFDAIALHNPYPAEYLDEAAWNQMVLKAFFIESPLSQVQGLETRANAKLARMLSDYAHERWAAGRSVNPQLWRLVGPFAEGDLVADLERVLHSTEPFEQQAAALACASAPSQEARVLLDMVPILKQHILEGHLTWERYS